MKHKYSERRGSSVISFRLLVVTITCLLSSKNLSSFASASDASVISSPSSPREFSILSSPTPPFITGRVFTNGIVQDVPHDKVILDAGLGEMALADVIGCCSTSLSSSSDGCSSSSENDAEAMKRVIIGKMPQFTSQQSLVTLQSAISAWDGGSGTWPQMTLNERIKAVQTFIQHLQSKRSEIVTALMYEIGKNQVDAESEFDRTMKFTKQVIEYIQSNTHSEFGSDWDASHGSTRLFMKRAAIGIVLCLGPYNYPLNETYATLIPALLMGNVILLKIPTVGGLSHLLTMEAFHKSFPPGTINFISGSGRVTMPPLMKSGRVDALAFIGASSAADRLIKDHPNPHRLKVFLQLEAKNMGVYLSNLFDNSKSAGEQQVEWETILKETVAGTLSYNGQRCTALKLLFVPKDKSEGFASMLAERVENLHVGLPWETKENPKDGTFTYPQVTPLPNRGRVEYMQALIQDAVSKGARVMNKNGGMIIGDQDESTLMVPAVLYPVTPNCRLYSEEQFGPIIPIAPYDSLAEVMTYAKDGKYGQQVSIFTSTSNHNNHAKESKVVADLIDRFSTVFGKININSQCGRSPDAAPFSGRRSSAMGTMSVSHALQEFSIPTLVSYKDVGMTKTVIEGVEVHSNFLTKV
mmetsp:Transcript_11456/g.17499  ORF Transcript_11456/g.17499 Transcript_11456/m.17499 type:complete len:638 (-) Transcript_11456:42-1955(-)